MKKMSFAALGLAGALLLAAPAQAHFMMAYTPQTALEKAPIWISASSSPTLPKPAT